MSEMGQQRPSNDVCVTSAITPTAVRKRTFQDFAFGPQGDIGLAYSITSSAVARSEGEIVTLLECHSMSPATGGRYQTFGMRLTVASHRVYRCY